VIEGAASNIGLYSIGDAARLLKTERRTLARWVQGYTENLKSEVKAYAPVIAGGRDSLLTFGDLIELMYVKGFRERRVELETIRQVSAKYSKQWETEYPFATKRFAIGAREILLQESDEWSECLSGQGFVFADRIAEQLVHTGDLASEWHPLGRDRAVVVDPRRSFGKPIDTNSGTSTYVLYKATEGGDSAESVAWWYGTNVESVLDSREFEISLL